LGAECNGRSFAALDPRSQPAPLGAAGRSPGRHRTWRRDRKLDRWRRRLPPSKSWCAGDRRRAAAGVRNIRHGRRVLLRRCRGPSTTNGAPGYVVDLGSDPLTAALSAHATPVPLPTTSSAPGRVNKEGGRGTAGGRAPSPSPSTVPLPRSRSAARPGGTRRAPVAASVTNCGCSGGESGARRRCAAVRLSFPGTPPDRPDHS